MNESKRDDFFDIDGKLTALPKPRLVALPLELQRWKEIIMRNENILLAESIVKKYEKIKADNKEAMLKEMDVPAKESKFWSDWMEPFLIVAKDAKVTVLDPKSIKIINLKISFNAEYQSYTLGRCWETEDGETERQTNYFWKYKVPKSFLWWKWEENRYYKTFALEQILETLAELFIMGKTKVHGKFSGSGNYYEEFLFWKNGRDAKII